ncbi:MAG: hypothetical protein V2A58_02240 [Planctomycetota bacterium]
MRNAGFGTEERQDKERGNSTLEEEFNAKTPRRQVGRRKWFSRRDAEAQRKRKEYFGAEELRERQEPIAQGAETEKRNRGERRGGRATKAQGHEEEGQRASEGRRHHGETRRRGTEEDAEKSTPEG